MSPASNSGPGSGHQGKLDGQVGVDGMNEHPA